MVLAASSDVAITLIGVVIAVLGGLVAAVCGAALLRPTTEDAGRGLGTTIVVVLVSGVLVFLAGFGVAIVVNVDEEPEPIDCVEVVDDVLALVEARGASARRVLNVLDDEEIEEQCGPIVARAIEVAGALDETPTTTEVPPTTTEP